MFIKICGITSKEDALLATALGANALGFIFATSPRQVYQEDVVLTIKSLPPEIITIGVFRNELPERVCKIANTLGLSGVQLHGNESPQQTRYIKQRVALVIKAFVAGQPEVSDFDEYGADLLLLDSPSPGSGKVFDWSLTQGVKDLSRFIVSGGLTPDNVEAAIKKIKPFGVDVASSVESSPGKKDPEKLRKFIVNAQKAFSEIKEDPQNLAIYDWMSDGL
jgi:phosphoribosylanthranilate isomerase